MDFFEHQESARKNTRLLVLYFILAVLGVVFAVNVIVIGVFFYLGDRSDAAGVSVSALDRMPPLLPLYISLATIAVIVLGSLFKRAALGKGGKNIAEMLGGKEIPPASREPAERRLLNVVEEMAIASGIAVPPVYLLEESGINAFAAGFTPDTAVIGVTRGAMELLDRQELQGVVAHEFSHILNGDMRLNLQLIGWLHGVQVIGLIGLQILRVAFYSGGSHSSRRSKNRVPVQLILIGAAVAAVGYIGVFFGKLIKSAVGREREYLADASAAQYTRYPAGLADALKKIGGLGPRAKLHSNRAEETSHLFFSNAIGPSLLNALSTHPPLDERIRRLDPSFDGTYPAVDRSETSSAKKSKQAVEHRSRHKQGQTLQELEDLLGGGRGPLGPATAAAGGAGPAVAVTAAAILAQVGQPDARHVEFARRLRESIPDDIEEAARTPFSARAVLYGLLLDEDESVRKQQLERLEAHADEAVLREFHKLLPRFTEVRPMHRLPLLELALPVLERMAGEQRQRFLDNIEQLARADRRISPFEYLLRRLLRRRLAGDQAAERKAAIPEYYSMNLLQGQVSLVLSTLANYGGTGPEQAAEAFLAAAALPRMKPLTDLRFRPPAECKLDELDEALDKLRKLTPPLKKGLVEACVAVAACDNQIRPDEAEFLRAVCEALDCPMPPILPGEELQGAAPNTQGD